MERRDLRAALIVAMSAAIAACGDEDTTENAGAAGANRPPTISGEPVPTAIEDQDYEFLPAASDPDGDPLLFNVSGKPGWMSFDPSSGRLSGRPARGDRGWHRGIVVSVTDGLEETALAPMDVEVVPAAGQANQAPQISGTPPPEATVGRFYNFVPTVTDADGDPLSFQIVNRPSWASFDSAIGGLSGTPAAADVGVAAGIVIRVSDGQAVSELGPFVITVNEPAGQNAAPIISGVPDPDAVVGERWSFTPQAADPDGDPLSFEVFNAPGWLSLEPASGTLDGVPAATDVGTHGNIILVVSDGQASASLPAFSVEVSAVNTPPTISGSPGAIVEAGRAYAFVPDAADADGDPLSFQIVNRPGWASFDAASGELSGTPGSTELGTYRDIAISVSDGLDSAALAPFSIEVVAANQAPTISGSPPGSVLVDQAYGFVPELDDPDGDALTLSVENLPSWASFDPVTGALSGTPAAGDVGTYAGIAITVSDGGASATLGPFAIEVVAIALGTATLSWLPPTENTDGSPLTDLAGFIVYWGTASGNYANSETIANAGVTSYVVGNLLAGQTYYFAVTAYNGDNLESSFSNEASKTIE